MYNNHEVVGLIPARGNSTGVKEKNLSCIGEKTLLQLAIEGADRSRYVDHVVVSTESNRIASIAIKHSAKLHLRDPKASTDHADASEVVRDFISNQTIIKDQNYIITYLQPTSPFRNAMHIDGAFELLETRDGHECISITENHLSPFKSVVFDSHNRVMNIFSSKYLTANRQTLPPTYRPNGAIYIFSKLEFEATGSFPIVGSVGYIMDEISSIDIDSYADLHYASFVYETNFAV